MPVLIALPVAAVGIAGMYKGQGLGAQRSAIVVLLGLIAGICPAYGNRK